MLEQKIAFTFAGDFYGVSFHGRENNNEANVQKIGQQLSDLIDVENALDTKRRYMRHIFKSNGCDRYICLTL